MSLSLNLKSFARSNVLASRLGQAATLRHYSAPANYLTYEKDPAESFFKPETQQLLRSITRLELEKIFRHRTVPRNDVECKFLTTKQLEDEVRKKFRHAERLLQMPPVISVMEEKQRVISTDKALTGFSDSSFVFTDVSYGLKNSERSVVIRHPDGVLEEAPYSDRKRVFQIYFPMRGRQFREPKMFESQCVKQLLESGEYEFLLDKLCIQFEPFEPKFHEITSQVYLWVNENHHFDKLRSTRHFGPMAFFLAWHKSIDHLLLDMIRNDFLKNGVELICLMFHLNNIPSDTSILKRFEELDEFERQIKVTIEKMLSPPDSIVKKIEKTDEDLKLDEICYEFIQDSYVKQHSAKKGQLEMALQTYKERHNELKNIAHGVN